MSSYESIAALLRIWDTLPQATGGSWPAWYWQIVALLRQFEEADDEESRAHISTKILRLLRKLPGGREALRALRSGNGNQRTEGAEGTAVTGPSPAAVESQIAALLHPPTVTRYTDILAPTHVQGGQRFAVIVNLARSPQGMEQEAPAIQAEPNATIRVALTPRGPELIGEGSKALQVMPEGSEPVVFYLRAAHQGPQSVTIDLWSGSDLLATVTRTFHLAEERYPDRWAVTPAEALDVIAYRAPHPDVVVRIQTRANRLSYALHYRDTDERQIDGEPLRCDPERYRYDLIREIEALSQGKDVDGVPVVGKPGLVREIEKIGWRMYNELFSEGMRREYRTWKDRQVHTVALISDEPWIPWELIKPYDDGIDDDFLCVQYSLSRWVAGGLPPAAEIPIESAAVIVPEDARLAQALQEGESLRSLIRYCGLADRSPAVSSYEAVTELLEGELPVRLWHLACHGNFDPDHPGNAPLVLQGGSRLRPNDLVGPAQRHLRADRPFVFLNACRAGQAGLSLTGLGGWAKVLVQDCHVGGLIAPVWSVDDGLARQMADAFYDGCQKPGMTVGEALRQARLKVRKAAPHDPTWLAYSLYAHPNGRVAFVGGHAEGRETAEDA